HPGVCHRLPVPLGGNRPEQRAVRREDERVLADLDRPQRLEVAARHPDGRAGEAAADEDQQNDDDHPEHDAREALVPRPRTLPSPAAPPRAVERIDRAAPAAAARRAHEKTPSARSAPCARSLRSRRNTSASVSLAAVFRTTSVAFPLRSST